MPLTISESILLFIAALGTLQGIILALFIYFRPGSDQSVNIFLSLYIACLSLIATTPIIEQELTWQKSFFIEPFPFLAGPLLYFYIVSFRKKIAWRNAFIHLLPFIAMTVFAYWFIGNWADKYPNEKQVPAEALHHPVAILYNIAKVSQLVFYYILTRRTLATYQRSIRQLFSDTSRINLDWIKWLCNGYLLFIAATMAVYALMFNYPQHFNLWMVLYAALMTPYVYLATFKGISQYTIWQVKPGLNKTVVEQEMRRTEGRDTTGTTAEKNRTGKTTIGTAKVDEIIKRTTELMEKEKLYQETELTLQQLAVKLGVPTYQVSFALNEGMQKSFYDVVNGYRVEEAKRLLLNPASDNYTILSIGFEAGFNSKTTFNTVFKKFTGITPTEYRDRKKMQMATN